MSITNSILLTFNIKDKNIYFLENCVSERIFKGVFSLIYEATLTYNPPSCCPSCKKRNESNSIIKYGLKVSYVRLPSVSKKQAILKLHKQRFLFKTCGSTFSAKSSIVDTHCSISTNTRHSILFDAKNELSEKDIAKNNYVSHATVNTYVYPSFYHRYVLYKA